jgi:hypothetical protein
VECVTVSDAWGIGELNLNLPRTLICLIYRHCYTVQKIVIYDKFVDDENGENIDKARKAHS